jgi:hypothetical protein
MRRRETGKLRSREHWRPGLGYSSRARARRKKWVPVFFKDSGKMSCFMRSDVRAEELAGGRSAKSLGFEKEGDVGDLV